MRRIETIATGGCQCGAVRYRATALLDNAHICHCRMCQRATGGPFAALVAAPDDAIGWTGRATEFRSSGQAVRGFCAACGTPLFYRGDGSGRTNLSIASLDDPAIAPPASQTGTESRLPWFADLCALPDGGETGADDPAWRDRIAASSRQFTPSESRPEPGQEQPRGAGAGAGG